MKKLDLEEIMNNLDQIRNVASRQDYNTSTAINKLINPTMQLIKDEYNRLNADKIELNCPQIVIGHFREADITDVDRYQLVEIGNDLDILYYKVN